MSIKDRFIASYRAFMGGATSTTITGQATTTSEQLELLYARMQPSIALRSKIQEIRDMDEKDPRVKKIHERTARAACKGGLRISAKPSEKRLIDLWSDYTRRLGLDNKVKLESDMRGALMEGNLPMQWVVDFESGSVLRGVRMPTESIKPVVGQNGQFTNPQISAYEQWDYLAGKPIAQFPLWQLMMVRIRPDNYDNFGSMGRPYLDATRSIWRQLTMTETDLVIRRHTRAPQRYSHVLEGADGPALTEYENKTKAKLGSVVTDFYSNRKGGVTALQGDSNLDQIGDVSHLLDTFFSGAPAPKGLFGYAGDLSRDILEDLKRDYYDELDALQDTVSYIYELGFHMDLTLKGINPDPEQCKVQYAERRTDTPNQRADLALKHQALGVPSTLNWETAGLDPVRVQNHLDDTEDENNPYPAPNRIGIPSVKITPGNRRKGESATSVANR